MKSKSMNLHRLTVIAMAAIMTIMMCAVPVSAAGEAVQKQPAYTVVELPAPSEYTTSKKLASAIFKDAFGNICAVEEDGFTHVLELGSVFSTDESGNIVGTDGKVLATAPFLVGAVWDNEVSSITLVDRDSVAVTFALADGAATLINKLPPAIYMDELGRIITADYFGRENIIFDPLATLGVN